MVAEGNKINQQNIGYAFAGPNSNTVATSLLQAAGLPLPKGNNLNGPDPAPGADMSFITGQYSAPEGYFELGENALARGVRDIHRGGTDIIAYLRDLAKQARAATRRKPVHPAMKLHNLLMDYQRNQQTRSYAPIPKIASRRGSADDSLMQAAGRDGEVPAWRQPFLAHAAASPVHQSAAQLARSGAPAPQPSGFAPLYERQDAPRGNDPLASVMSKFVTKEEFIELFEQKLDREARMPPSGNTGFDPLLSAFWPGRKLPN